MLKSTFNYYLQHNPFLLNIWHTQFEDARIEEIALYGD